MDGCARISIWGAHPIHTTPLPEVPSLKPEGRASASSIAQLGFLSAHRNGNSDRSRMLSHELDLGSRNIKVNEIFDEISNLYTKPRKEVNENLLVIFESLQASMLEMLCL